MGEKRRKKQGKIEKMRKKKGNGEKWRKITENEENSKNTRKNEKNESKNVKKIRKREKRSRINKRHMNAGKWTTTHIIPNRRSSSWSEQQVQALKKRIAMCNQPNNGNVVPLAFSLAALRSPIFSIDEDEYIGGGVIGSNFSSDLLIAIELF